MRGRNIRAHDDFHALILLVTEHLITIGRVVQPEPMRDDETRVDLAVLYSFEQGSHITLDVGLTAFQLEGSIHKRADRKFVDEPAVDAGNRNGSAASAGQNNVAKNGRPVGL